MKHRLFLNLGFNNFENSVVVGYMKQSDLRIFLFMTYSGMSRIIETPYESIGWSYHSVYISVEHSEWWNLTFRWSVSAMFDGRQCLAFLLAYNFMLFISSVKKNDVYFIQNRLLRKHHYSDINGSTKPHDAGITIRKNLHATKITHKWYSVISVNSSYFQWYRTSGNMQALENTVHDPYIYIYIYIHMICCK